MKTCTYQQVQDNAAEMAGRPRDKLPISEQAMLVNFFALELKVMWNQCAWPELCDNLQSYTPVNTNGLLTISKNEGQAGEIGDVLWVGTADPRNPTGPRACTLRFSEGNGQIYLLDPIQVPQGVVWVDWQLPAPDFLTTPPTPTTTIPARFYQALSFKAAAKLLTIDGQLQQAAALQGFANENLDWMAVQPEMKQPEWRGIRIRR